jgi:hypothetical protein
MTDDADTLYGYLMADQWRAMLSFYRGWLAVHCPAYPRYETELECGWLGTLFIRREQLAKVAKLPVRDPMYCSAAEAEAELRATITNHLTNVTGTYRRWCERMDYPEPAEKRTAQTLKNIGLGHLTEGC